MIIYPNYPHLVTTHAMFRPILTCWVDTSNLCSSTVSRASVVHFNNTSQLAPCWFIAALRCLMKVNLIHRTTTSLITYQPMVNMLWGGTCSHSGCFQFFLSFPLAFVLQYCPLLTLLPFEKSYLSWWDYGKHRISSCQPLSIELLQGLHNSCVRVTMVLVNNVVPYHSQYHIHWRTSPLQPELAFHNQPLKCKT